VGLLTLVRHGQASFLQSDYDRLSELGKRQAEILGQFWAKRRVEFDHIYYGPARRQIGTGEIAGTICRAAGLTWPEPVTLPEFDEYAGIEVMRTFVPGLVKTHEDIRLLEQEYRAASELKAAARAFEKMFQRVTRLWVNGELDSPDVESWSAFCARVDRGLQRVCRNGGNVAVFSSGGVMAAAVRRALDLSPVRTLELSWTPRNASYSEFLFSGDRFSLQSFNTHPHLDLPELLTWR
jgi:broad specificity phosphatase PhoE